MILKDEFYQIMDQAIRIKRDKYQRWPVHIVAQAGKVFHKSGELMKAASEFKYEMAKEVPDQQQQYDDMVKFAYETIATTLRFLERLKPRPVDPNAVVEEPNPYQIMMPIDPSVEIPVELNYGSTQRIVLTPENPTAENATHADAVIVPVSMPEMTPEQHLKAIEDFKNGSVRWVGGPGVNVEESGDQIIITTE